jgi:ABC-type transport system involved in multi-copper enzyme maturation permease subunit
MTPAPLFGVLILDRNPLVLADLPGLTQAWLQDAGGFAAAGLLLYLLAALRGPADQPESARARMPVTTFMLVMAVVSLLGYAAYAALLLAKIGPDTVNVEQVLAPGDSYHYVPPKFSTNAQPLALMIAGLAAVLGLASPFLADLPKLRANRVWALSKVGFLEARRSPLFIVFLLFLAVFMFPAQWFIPTKAEDELRTTVGVTSFTSAFLLLVPAVVLAAFRIPNDIKYQTIYTIVSKPVERFEIVLGRFFGYAFLMTVALALMTALGYLFLATSNIDPKAAEETSKARMPVRGTLRFQSKKGETEGTNVGREFEYRKYIPGHPASSERAIWSFPTVPAGLAAAGRTEVPCEMTFDIFRLTKGDENVGVYVNLRFCSHAADQEPPTDRSGLWRWRDDAAQRAYEADLKAAEAEVGRPLAGAKPGTREWAKANELAKKHGFFEVGTVEVYDYHPTTVMVPPGVFENARAGDPKGTPRLQVYVKCLSPGQMLGMAPGDLYILEGNQPYVVNYFKNAVGLWCRVAIVIGVAVALSTYLSGVVSLLATVFLYVAAAFQDHLRDVATNNSVGGGPFESLTRLLRTESPTTPLDPTATNRTVGYFDMAYAWLFRRFANLVPDVDAFTWTDYLKEGFNINGEYLLMNLIMLAGYLLPWAVLSYYLIRNREVAA